MDITEIAQRFRAIYKQANDVYKVRVDDATRNKNISRDELEHLFDGMLDFANDAEMLFQYKRLCRHYLYIYPQVVGYYINAYRECWDIEPKIENE
jgi:hypothetical protein